jgi:Ca2+-binding RTX toxin-like protein
VYLDVSSISATISSATGGNFEQIAINPAPAVTQVLDTTDATVVSLSATPSITEAGGVITYTATLTSAAHAPVVITLSNNQQITIANGATSGSLDVTVDSTEDVYSDASSISMTITGAIGGNFELLTINPAPAVTQVTDTIDATAISLSATPSITEAATSITYTATLASAAHAAVVVTLSNGLVINIANGATSGSASYPVVANEDVYLDVSSVSATISSAVGGNFELISINPAPAVTQITDTINATTVSLGANLSSITEAGGVITYTATLSNAAQGPVTVTLSNGQQITIANGATTGTVDYTVVSNEDVYIDASSISTTITNATGGNFEQLNINPAPAVTLVTDTITAATVSLSATSSVTEAGGVITYTATLSNAAQGPVTVTLSNGQQITIANNATTGSVNFTVAANEDVYIDASSISTTIISAIGGNFELLTVNPAAAVTQITDTITNASLTLSGPSSVTEGQAATYTLTVSNAPQTNLVVSITVSHVTTTGTDIAPVTFNVTILAGLTSAQFVVNNLNDALVEGNESYRVTINSTSGGNYENLVPAQNFFDTTIVDNDFAPVAQNVTRTVNEDNSANITFVATDADGTIASYTVTSQPANGVLTVNGGTAVFVPDANWSGSTSFTYTATDNAGNVSAPATVQITVTPVADAPTLIGAQNISIAIAGDTSITTNTAITQDNIEAELGLAAGTLDTLNPPGATSGVNTGPVNVFNGSISTSYYSLGQNMQISFQTNFNDGENDSRYATGINDMAVLMVTDANGNRTFYTVNSSEQIRNGSAAVTTFNYTSTKTGVYRFDWMVLNSVDSTRGSTLSITQPTFVYNSTTYGLPIPLALYGLLTDLDGSEILSLTISGVPATGGFNQGTNLGSGVWSFTAANLTGLEYLPPANFLGLVTLTAIAKSTETANGSIATTQQSFTITVDETTNTVAGNSNVTQTIGGTNADNLIHGYAGDDTINAAAGQDVVYGGLGNDILNGGDGDDWLSGGLGNDILNGQNNNDTLFGGQGNDTLSGGTGQDRFIWTLGDNAGNPTDTITDFTQGVGGDVLDLTDLLVGESLTADSLDNYLNITYNSGNNSTTISIDTDGGASFNPSQSIVLSGVDLTAGGTLATVQAVLNVLIQAGNLVTDV